MHRGLKTGRAVRVVCGAGVFLAAAAGAGATYYGKGPLPLASDAARFGGSAVARLLYAGDLRQARTLSAAYVVGVPRSSPGAPAETWAAAARTAPRLAFDARSAGLVSLPSHAFVYESPDSPFLARLREDQGLDEVIAGHSDEYEAQLALGRWAGTRFPHRMDVRPPDYPWFDPVLLLDASARGEAYWCEIAARLTVYAAASVGWPARIAVVSRVGGSPYDHAVAELWSNQFRKWYVLDTDYNHVFEVEGRPLSAFELCHAGPELAAAGKLSLRRFAPVKEGVDPTRDQIPYFAYVHVDLRNDWLSRRLRPGSPAGGDRNTLWTRREGTPDLLTFRQREDEQDAFDWPVNSVELRALAATDSPGGSVTIRLGFRAYAPYFEGFALSVDHGDWARVDGAVREVVLAPGTHEVAARVLTRGGPGPPASVRLEVRPGS